MMGINETQKYNHVHMHSIAHKSSRTLKQMLRHHVMYISAFTGG